MADYAQLTANVNTPITDANRVLGWNGVSGDYSINTGTISWGKSQQGLVTWDTTTAAKRYYGKVLLYASVNTADTYHIKLKVLNPNGVQVGSTFEWSHVGDYRSDSVAYLFDLPKDHRVEIDWRCYAGYKKKANMTFSLYADDRNVPIDVTQPPTDVPPEMEVKYKDLTATLRVNNANVTSAYQKYMYLAETVRPEISIPATYDKNHINLWDYFYEKNGRRPNRGEKVHFIIPEDRLFIAPFSYTVAKRYADVAIPNNSFYKNYRYTDERVVPGSAAVSLVGWDPTLGNDITVEVRGTIIGSFFGSQGYLTPMNKADGKPLAFNAAFRANNFPDPVAAWSFMQRCCGVADLSLIAMVPYDTPISMTNPIKMPAFESPVHCKLIVRAGAYVLGGGGSQQTAVMYNRIDYPGSMQFASYGPAGDSTNIQGGPAIRATSGAIVQISNYGYIAGGGGGGNTVGSVAAGLMDNSAIYAIGGSGAPLAGLNPFTPSFPLYFDLAYIKTLPLIDQITSTFVLDVETLQNVQSKKSIEFSYARAIAAVDWNRVGHDSNKDNYIDSPWGNPYAYYGDIKKHARLLSPTPGSQSASANNYNVGVSGSGGAPGVDGQKYTMIKDGSSYLSRIPNVQGLKGQALVQLSGAQIVNQNFAGSTFKP